jgi:predicted membrane channel-forming protein YqfA (hemolysin III family)
MKILYALSALSYLSLAVLVGYYSYEKDGVLSIFNNICFFVLGMLFLSTLFHIFNRNEKVKSKITKTEKEK